MTARLKTFLITVIPATAAVGRYVLPIPVAGVTLFLFRLIVIGGLLATPLIAYKLYWWKKRTAKLYVLLGYFWVVWGGISIYWAPDLLSAVNDVAAVGFGFAVGILLLNLGAASEAGIQSLRRGWVLAFVVTAAVATWEIATGSHLPSSFVEQKPDYALRAIVISTFGNPNNYGAFLVLSFPFLLTSLHKIRRIPVKLMYFGLVISAIILVFLSASRSAAMGIGLQLIVYIFLFGGLKRISWGVLVAILGLAVLGSLGVTLDDYRFWTKLLSALSGEELSGSGSLGTRIALTLSGIWMVGHSFGMGVGAGGFEHVMARGEVPYSGIDQVNPHNFIIEVASEYGLLVVTAFAGFLVRGLAIAYARKDSKHREVRELCILMVVGYVFACVANSSYVEVSVHWVFIASFLCVTIFLEGVSKWQQ